MYYLLRALSCACVLLPIANAAQVAQLMLTKALPPTCSSAPPVPETTFSSSDPTAYLWVVLNGITPGDVASDEYITPSGQVYAAASGAWPPFTEGGNVCLTDAAFDIAGAPPASMPGNWTLRFKVNGLVLSTLTFTISGGSGGGGGGGTAQVQYIMMTRSLPSGCDISAPPVPETSFLTTDGTAYFWAAVANTKVGDIAADDYYGPDGQYYSAASGAWPAVQTAGGTCLTDSAFKIAGAAPANMPGNWTVKLKLNGQVLATTSFTIRGVSQPCSYGLSATSQSFQASGGSGVVSVTATAGCTWSASANSPWISVQSGASGNGNGTVNYFVNANSGPARSGTLTIAGQTYTVTEAGVGAVTPGTTMVLPQFVYGGGWYTALYFTNTTGTSVSFPVAFVGEDGNPLSVPSVGGSSTTVNLGPRATYMIEAPNTGGTTQGYVSLALPAGVTAYGVFRLSLAGVPDQEAVVPLSPTTNTTNTLIWDDSNYVTGVALVNPSSMGITVFITVRDSSGQTIGSSSVTLGARSKTAVVLRNLPGLSGVAGHRGSADFTVASGNLAVLGLRFNGSAFTSIPAMGQ